MNLLNSNKEILLLLLTYICLIGSAVCTVMMKSLLKAAIALGLTSAVLTVIMFFMNSYLAAVFELSVCAGLVTVVFISAISLSKPQTNEEMIALTKQRIKRYIFLPVLLLIICAGLFFLRPYFSFDGSVNLAGVESTVQEILWNDRQVDMLGQIIVILAGIFGVAVLFKERGAE